MKKIRQLFSETNLQRFLESITEDRLLELFQVFMTMEMEKDTEEKKSLIPEWFFEKFYDVFGYNPRKATLGTFRMLVINLGKFIQNNPQYLTPRLYNELSQTKRFFWVVRHYRINQRGEIEPTDRRIRDLQNLETIAKLDLLRMLEKKIDYMLQILTPSYLKKLSDKNPGTFFSALKTLFSGYHILSIDYKPDEEMIKSFKAVEQDENNPEKKKEILIKEIRRRFSTK